MARGDWLLLGSLPALKRRADQLCASGANKIWAADGNGSESLLMDSWDCRTELQGNRMNVLELQNSVLKGRDCSRAAHNDLFISALAAEGRFDGVKTFPQGLNPETF